MYGESVIARILKAGRLKVAFAAAVLIALTTLADWKTGPRVSLALLYVVPMMLGGTILAPWQTILLAAFCSFLRSCFDVPTPQAEIILRFFFAWLAYTCAGLFVTALIRNRVLEEQLQTLVESSPAAILTMDRAGKVLAANRAARSLFQIPAGASLEGRYIADYVPLLSDALQAPCGPEGFRTAAECQGRRENGEIFMANTWFSSYMVGTEVRLAAIVVDSSEEMRDREEQGLRHLMRVNRIAAAAVSHEVRNLSSAISLVSSNLQANYGGVHEQDLRSLTALVHGLERIASCELQTTTHESPDEVRLQEVLDHLRIIIEPAWQEIGGSVVWPAAPNSLVVTAEAHGLLQVFLNLARNSHRAVQDSQVKELRISVALETRTACVYFHDSGPGVTGPERLFVPFQPGSDGAGLGLYVSRAVMRSYGGDLRLVPQDAGACFRVEIPVVHSHPDDGDR